METWKLQSSFVDTKHGVGLQSCVQAPSSETREKISQKSSEKFIENIKKF